MHFCFLWALHMLPSFKGMHTRQGIMAPVACFHDRLATYLQFDISTPFVEFLSFAHLSNYFDTCHLFCTPKSLCRVEGPSLRLCELMLQRWLTLPIRSLWCQTSNLVQLLLSFIHLYYIVTEEISYTNTVIIKISISVAYINCDYTAIFEFFLLCVSLMVKWGYRNCN